MGELEPSRECVAVFEAALGCRTYGGSTPAALAFCRTHMAVPTELGCPAAVDLLVLTRP